MVRAYLIRGIGNVVGEAKFSDKETIVLSFPAICFTERRPDGSTGYGLDSIVPAYIEDSFKKIQKGVSFKREDVIVEGECTQTMIRTYETWKNLVIKLLTGLEMSKAPKIIKPN